MDNSGYEPELRLRTVDGQINQTKRQVGLGLGLGVGVGVGGRGRGRGRNWPGRPNEAAGGYF